MPRLLFVLLLTVSSLATAGVRAPAQRKAMAPALAFNLAENDTHFLELTEWAERNQLLEKSAARKKIDVTVVGCAGTPECYFFYQKNGRMHVYDPRLKRDWTQNLRKGASLERIRSMRCYTHAPGKGQCRVWETAVTRSQLIASAPAMARSLGMFVRSPANVDILRHRRFRR